ncbi:MAG: hypothetical protein WCO60_03020 [Verrucomicrobiota bacterium]
MKMFPPKQTQSHHTLHECDIAPGSRYAATHHWLRRIVFMGCICATVSVPAQAPLDLTHTLLAASPVALPQAEPSLAPIATQPSRNTGVVSSAAAAGSSAALADALAAAAIPSVPALPAPNAKGASLPELPADGYWIESAPINELFQYLARYADLQFFNNNELSDPRYNVTGHLKLTDPIRQMEDLAIAYGLTVYRQGQTVHLMNEAQMSRLPVEFMSYQLKYLRGAGSPRGSSSGSDAAGGGAAVADFEKLKGIIKPMLTRDVGQIEFEEKTNTLLVTDNNVKLKKVREVLETLDIAKKQIAINVRILRVRKSKASNVGVDWSAALGGGPGAGVPINISQSLNALFNLPDVKTFAAGLTSVDNRGQGIVFDAMRVQAILRALHEHDLVSQESCPTVITEDNEQGIISFVDRFPVITSTVTATSAGQSTTDKVRYKIDEEDASSVDKPDKSREIGVTLSVTPTILPDGTVRMRLRPRVANVVEVVTGKSGNSFPRVSESTVEGISRIPNGQSLFLGGFYDSNEKQGSKKVPVLGSIPLVSHLFSSKSKTNEQISLVFIITPTVYDASSTRETDAVSKKIRTNSGFNRTNSNGLASPLLPDSNATNEYLPLPSDSIEPKAEPKSKKSTKTPAKPAEKDSAPPRAIPVLPPGLRR